MNLHIDKVEKSTYIIDKSIKKNSDRQESELESSFMDFKILDFYLCTIKISPNPFLLRKVTTKWKSVICDKSFQNQTLSGICSALSPGAASKG